MVTVTITQGGISPDSGYKGNYWEEDKLGCLSIGTWSQFPDATLSLQNVKSSNNNFFNF